VFTYDAKPTLLDRFPTVLDRFLPPRLTVGTRSGIIPCTETVHAARRSHPPRSFEPRARKKLQARKKLRATSRELRARARGPQAASFKPGQERGAAIPPALGLRSARTLDPRPSTLDPRPSTPDPRPILRAPAVTRHASRVIFPISISPSISISKAQGRMKPQINTDEHR